MNIAIFTRSTIAHFVSGGMETHLKILIEGLSEKGHEITVITTALPSNTVSEIASDSNVKYFYIKGTTPGLNPLTIWEKLFYKLRILKIHEVGSKNYFFESLNVFTNLHKAKPFDCVISQSTGAYGLLDYSQNDLPPIFSIIHGTIKSEIKNRRSSLRNIKNIIRFYLIDLPKWMYEFKFKNHSFFVKCSKIISVNELLTENFVQDYSDLKNKIITIENGVDTKVFNLGVVKYSYFTMLYVGRLDIEKGIEEIIRAIKMFKDSGIPIYLKIIGGGSHEEYLKKIASDFGLLDQQVSFVGQVKNEDLAQYYQQSHIFCLPTKREEGHPMTVSEAFCCGLPVVCTKKGGLAKIITDNIDGVFIESSAESIYSVVKELYENRQKLSKLSENAHLKGFKNFTKEAMIAKYIETISV